MISQAYKNYLQKYNDIREDKDNYLFWLENDILLELNDNNGLIYSVSPTIKSIYPDKSPLNIANHICSIKTEADVAKHIKHLWSYLSEDQKQKIIKKPMM
jgi:hypothetical protein